MSSLVPAASPPPYVFLSFASRDKALATRLGNDLRLAGVEIWHGVERLSPGDAWQKQIKQALDNAEVLLVFWSGNSARSGWIEQEASGFRERGKPVIPLLVDEEGVPSLPSQFQDVRAIDFRRSYDEGLAELLVALPTAVRTHPTSKPAVTQSKGYVFLSYAEEDSDFADQLKAFFQQRGYGYWDYRESDRNFHTFLFLELEEAITSAAATVCVLSPDWKRSRWTVREYCFSEDVETPVFLVKAKELGPTLAIAGLPFIDFVCDAAKGFERLGRALDRKGL